ncbi:MAG: hypothetical protein JNL98_04255 [Bryobacterales bacterium]|nr:hypothetical protein [Bryobacterales bacterium]
MRSSVAVKLAGSLLLAGLLASAEPVQSAPAAPIPANGAASAAGDVQSFFQAVSGLFQGIEQTAKNLDATDNAAAAKPELAKSGDAKPGDAKSAPAEAKTSDDQKAEANRNRSWKNSMILISGGAASGAAIGAAVTKDKKGAIVGAVAGGVAGLIYDRVTHKNPGKI